MKYLPLLLLPFTASALDVLENDTGTSTLTCDTVAWTRENDIVYNLYLNDTKIQSGDLCNFVVVNALPIGTHVFTVTAESKFFGTESGKSNPAELNVLAVQVPNAPTQLNWE